MLKNFMALGLTTLVRVLTGFVLFIVIARYWGAEAFGEFMYLFTVASLLVIACEFGFSQQILREVGRTPERAHALMSEYLGAKVWLTVLIFALAIVFALVMGLNPRSTLTLLLLLAAATLLSFSDFLMACLRALGRFGSETTVTIKGNLLYFAAGLGVLYAKGGFVEIGMAMLGARLVHIALTHLEYRRHVQGRMVPDLRVAAIIPVIRRGAAYGIDGAVAQVFSNIDTILVSHMLGNAATGLYQAGARLYQGACLIAPIFGSLYLPRLARAGNDKHVFSQQFRQLSHGLTVCGLLLALAFIASGRYIGLLFDHADFARLDSLLPWFGVLLFTRYVASIYGTVLTALGGQAMRVVIYLISLLVMSVGAILLMDVYGVLGMILAVTLAHIVLIAGLGAWISRYEFRVHGLLLALVAGALLSGFVYWKTGLKIG